MPFIELFLAMNEEKSKSKEVMEEIASFMDKNDFRDKYTNEEIINGLNFLIALVELSKDM